MHKNNPHNYGNSSDYDDDLPHFFQRKSLTQDGKNDIVIRAEHVPIPQTQETQMETLRQIIREEINIAMSEALKAYFGNG